MLPHLYKFLFLLLLAPTALTSAAQAQPAEMPSPEQLFEEADTALGWNAKMKQEIGHIEASAHVSVEGRTYDTVVNSRINTPAGGDARFTMISKDGTVTYGDTDGAIWFKGEDGEKQPLPDAMAAFVHGHQFHRRALFPRQELATLHDEVSEDYFADERVFVVEGTTRSGAALKYYFSQFTKKLVGYHLVVMEEDGPHAMDFTLKDWRTSGGQSLFWRMDINDRGKLYVYRYNQILMLP
ncbi:MAG: hypothetical protein HWE08_00315 [Alphaproteobacteria bacterium]|nr:hypothetical protein [Alphaproteobacteria bacterium]